MTGMRHGGIAGHGREGPQWVDGGLSRRNIRTSRRLSKPLNFRPQIAVANILTYATSVSKLGCNFDARAAASTSDPYTGLSSNVDFTRQDRIIYRKDALPQLPVMVQGIDCSLSISKGFSRFIGN
jgi:hypothetical protein